MDTLTLPEKGWALAYPNPQWDLAYLLHTECGWQSPKLVVPEASWAQANLMDEHQCRQGGGAR